MPQKQTLDGFRIFKPRFTTDTRLAYALELIRIWQEDLAAQERTGHAQLSYQPSYREFKEARKAFGRF